MHTALLAGSPLSSRKLAQAWGYSKCIHFLPSPAITNSKLPCWAKTHTEDLLTWLINWGFASLFSPDAFNHFGKYLEVLSKENPLKSLFPTLQMCLAFNSSPPILSPCPLACLQCVFTESLPSFSFTPQPNFHFLNYLYSPPSLLIMHFLMQLSFPGITTL